MLIVCIAVSACGPIEEYDHSHEHAVIAGFGKADDVPLPTKDWTFIFYGAADNDLGFHISSDIGEIEKVGSTEDVNMVAFLDTARRGAKRMYIEKDVDSEENSRSYSLGEVDSGDPETLIEFASWTIENFPAEKYALVINSHGSGVDRSTAFDHKTENSISTEELGMALNKISELTGKRLDLVGTDACLMQTIEMVVEIAESVQVYVANAKQSVASGWHYTEIMSKLVENPAMDGVELGDIIVSEYYEWRSSINWSEEFVPDPYLSAIDIDQLTCEDCLVDGLMELAEFLTDAIESNPTVIEDFFFGYDDRYGYASIRSLIWDAEDVLVWDAEDVDSLSSNEEIQSLITELDSQIDLYQYLTVYLPGTPKPSEVESYRESCRFCSNQEWLDLIDTVAGTHCETFSDPLIFCDWPNIDVWRYQDPRITWGWGYSNGPPDEGELFGYIGLGSSYDPHCAELRGTECYGRGCCHIFPDEASCLAALETASCE
jgi:hypothetical protein